MFNTKTENISLDKIISPVSNHGAMVSLKAPSMAKLVEQLNDQSHPYAIVGSFVFGEGNYHCVIELDRGKKVIFKNKNKNKKGK